MNVLIFKWLDGVCIACLINFSCTTTFTLRLTTTTVTEREKKKYHDDVVDREEEKKKEQNKCT